MREQTFDKILFSSWLPYNLRVFVCNCWMRVPVRRTKILTNCSQLDLMMLIYLNVVSSRFGYKFIYLLLLLCLFICATNRVTNQLLLDRVCGRRMSLFSLSVHSIVVVMSINSARGLKQQRKNRYKCELFYISWNFCLKNHSREEVQFS